jgi:RNA polymerase sigma-54 factor
MGLELRQSLKLTQQLIMTPQLQQAIKLLQLSRLELAEVIQKELNENPILEEGPDAPESPAEERDREDMMEGYSEAAPAPEPAVQVDEGLAALIRNLDRPNFREHPSGYADDERADLEPAYQKPQTLYDHLMWQLTMSGYDDELGMACAVLIGNINDNGYLTADPFDLARRNRIETMTMEHALERVQDFDPTGVAARDLRECLMIQLRAVGQEDTLAWKVVDRHLHHLEKRNYKAITSALRISMDELGKAVKQIESLEPKPGRPFGGQEAQYITPDIYVIKVGDEYVIQLNDDGLPKLRVSNIYKKILENRDKASAVDREYIQEKLRGAVWLIRSIHQRQRTIYRVTQSIVNFQREFLDKGVAYLKPLILRDVAEDISMHESTISRVTTNKYVHTPQGIFELKYFFNTGISAGHGDSVASESVKNEIQRIVASEAAEKPYSDQDIVEILARKEIRIARRTVTKYREMLGILSSTKRRKVF